MVIREYTERRELIGTTIELRQAPGLHKLLKSIYKSAEHMKLEEVPPEVGLLIASRNESNLTVSPVDFAPGPIPC